MKYSLFLLSLVGTVALAQETCQCDEAPVCIQSWPESCVCENDAKVKCFNKCGGPIPQFQTCVAPPAPTSTSTPQPETCTCDPGFCIQSWPESCHCENENKMRCFNQCGGDLPDFQTCVEPRAALPAPKVEVAAREPEPTETCECDEALCLQSWPESCTCKNEAKAKCFKKCGGPLPQFHPCVAPPAQTPTPEPELKCLPEPIFCASLHGPMTCECRNAVKLNKMRCTKIWLELEDCSASQPEARALDATGASCQCDNNVCIQSWPESCYCEKANEDACFQKCGVVPSQRTCPPLPNKTLVTSVAPAQPTHKPCGGGRGSNLKCDRGFVCIADPFSDSCGPDCDGFGICVQDKMCGGFAGLRCSTPGQVCMDDPRDQCDPDHGADCAGLCVWPH